MASYSNRVKRDIARWRDAGLVDAATAGRLVDDVEANAARGFSFGSILAILSALLFAASVLIFVAANWEALPRLFRVALVLAVIAVTYVGGAILKRRDHDGMAEAAWLIGGAAFGAGIALIGQMYHLSGDERMAVLTWCFGVGLAAALLRSGISTAACVVLAGAWMWMGEYDFWRDDPVDYAYLALLAALWALSLWTRGQVARHLIVLSLIFFAVVVYLRIDLLAVPVGLALLSAGLFAFATRDEEVAENLLRLGGGAPVHALIGFGAAMLLVQFAVEDEPAAFMLAALVTFAGSVAALLLAGRESRILRWLAYALFGAELVYVYLQTVGTMLGTAGFLLAPGLLLAIMAFIVLRIERRMRAPRIVEGDA